MRRTHKSILTNTLAQLVAKFVGAGLTLVTTALIIRLSGTSVYGDLAKALAIVAIGFTAIDFGLNASAIRDMHASRKPLRVLRSVFLARLFLSLLAVLGANLLISQLPGGYTPALKNAFWLGSLAIIFQGLFTSANAWFQFRENYWRSAVAVIAGSLVGAALTLWYTLSAPSVGHFLLANSLGYLVIAAVSLSLLPRSFLFRFFTAPLSLRATLTRSLLLGGILLASVVASKSDTIILGIFRPSGEVGEYGFAYRLFEVLLVLPTFVMNATYPLLVKLEAKKTSLLFRETSWLLTALGLLVALVVWLSAPLLVFIKPGLSLAITSVRYLMYGLPLFFVTSPLMWSLITRRRDGSVFLVYLCAALANILLNLAFAPSFGAPASALITGATELFIFLSLLYFSRKYDQTLA